MNIGVKLDFFFPGEYKLKINKLCLRLRCLYYIYIFYYKLHLGSPMCKVIVVKSDSHIMIDKL